MDEKLKILIDDYREAAWLELCSSRWAGLKKSSEEAIEKYLKAVKE